MKVGVPDGDNLAEAGDDLDTQTRRLKSSRHVIESCRTNQSITDADPENKLLFNSYYRRQIRHLSGDC